MSKLSRYSALLEEAQDREDEARSAFNRYVNPCHGDRIRLVFLFLPSRS